MSKNWTLRIKKRRIEVLFASALLGFFASTTVAVDYHVAALNGDDSSPGSLAAPFRTISKAVTVMSSGDRCFIHEGIYRETVLVTADDLWFGAYSNAHVVVSGCDLASNSWSTYSGNIMQLAVPTQVSQLFVNGQRMNLARYPNEDAAQNMLSNQEWEDSDVTGLSTAGTGLARVDFDTMNEPAGHWVGGNYSGKNGSDPFTASIGKIISSSGNTITMNELPWISRIRLVDISVSGPGRGYIINHLNALDSPGEWYWDNGQLYLYPKAGMNLATAAVETRSRLVGFYLDGCIDVVLENINFHAATLYMDQTTTCRIDSCSFRYPGPWSLHSYPTGHDYGGTLDGTVGLHVSGSRNILTNSYIAHSWGSGIRMDGVENRFDNCIIEDVNWLGRRMGGIQMFGTSNRVENSTIRDCGRDGIDGAQRKIGYPDGTGTWHVVRYNRIENFGWLAADSGGFYINHQGLGPAYSEISYNEFFYNHGELYSVGIFIDNGTHTLNVHHNLVVGPQQWGINVNDNRVEKVRDVIVANNTIWDIDSWGLRIVTTPGHSPTNVYIANNLSISGGLIFPSAIQSNNSYFMPASEFEDAANYDFRLAAGSQYIDSGIVIPGITDGYVGSAPDRGAYESGLPVWQAGSSVQIPPAHSLVDTDSDTVPDLVEWVLGTDPLDPITDGITLDATVYQIAGQVSVVPISISANNLTVEVNTQTNWFYYSEYTDHLTSNAWNTLAHIRGTGGTQSTLFNPSPDATGFLKVSAALLPLGESPMFGDGFDSYSPVPANDSLFAVVNTLWTGHNLTRLFDSVTTGQPAESGSHYVQFLGETGGGTLSCSLLTEIGKTYVLNFSLARVNSNGFPQLMIDITGSNTQSVSAEYSAGDWQYVSVRFTASSRFTTIQFSEPNVNTAGQAPMLDSMEIYEIYN